MELEAAIGERLRGCGVRHYGFCRAAALDGAPWVQRPACLLPEAKSLIALAMPLDLRVIERLPDTRDEYMAEFRSTNALLDQAVTELSDWLVGRGLASVGVPNRTTDHWRKKIGSLSHRHVARAAGLGEIGRNNLLLVPHYFGAMRLATVVTVAELQPTPPPGGAICRDCGQCVAACPTGALPPVGEQGSIYDREIGRLMEQEVCRQHQMSTPGRKRCGLCMAACLQ